MEARNPGRAFIHHTSNLARGIGTEVSTSFNNQLRQYARDNNKYLLDVAAILSHDPSGNPCYDNRDGVPYSAGNASETYRQLNLFGDVFERVRDQFPALADSATVWSPTQGVYPQRDSCAMVLGMTHEEIVTWHAAHEVRVEVGEPS